MEEDAEIETADFEHLDYLEPGDDVPLTSSGNKVGKANGKRLSRVSFRNAAIAGTLLILLFCGIMVVVIFLVGVKKQPL